MAWVACARKHLNLKKKWKTTEQVTTHICWSPNGCWSHGGVQIGTAIFATPRIVKTEVKHKKRAGVIWTCNPLDCGIWTLRSNHSLIKAWSSVSGLQSHWFTVFMEDFIGGYLDRSNGIASKMCLFVSLRLQATTLTLSHSQTLANRVPWWWWPERVKLASSSDVLSIP